MKKQQIPRHNSIGEKIRAARKKRGMTLGELANGICSLGKMSNIENGHVPVTEEELNKFSDRLDIPTSYFSDPEINNKLNEIDLLKQKIRDLFGLRQWDPVLTELHKLREKVEIYEIPSREIDYFFLLGEYYLRTNKWDLAEEYLTNVINVTENNNYNLRIKLKAHNALAGILFANKRISKCIDLLEKALEFSKESPTITKEERDNIYFNLSILYLYIGANYQSLQRINKVKHHIIQPLETDYIKLLIRFLEDDSIEDVREDLLLLRERLQQTNNKEGILCGWALTIYTFMTSYPNSELVKQLKENFLFDFDSICGLEGYKEQNLALLQLSIYVCLNNNIEQTCIQELINKTKPLLSQVNDSLLIARNHYLEGKYFTQYQPNEVSSLSFYKEALASLKDDFNGLLKADILYEICKLKNAENEEMQGLEIFHDHLKQQFLFTHFHELTLPTFKY